MWAKVPGVVRGKERWELGSEFLFWGTGTRSKVIGCGYRFWPLSHGWNCEFKTPHLFAGCILLMLALFACWVSWMHCLQYHRLLSKLLIGLRISLSSVWDIFSIDTESLWKVVDTNFRIDKLLELGRWTREDYICCWSLACHFIWKVNICTVTEAYGFRRWPDRLVHNLFPQ